MILKHIGNKTKLFNGEIKNYRKHYKFIDNNLDFRQVEIYNNDGKLIYRSYPMQTVEAKKLTDFIYNQSDMFPLMCLTI
jgi:major membrane immunogen (membrane-anchored lipoprotein)